MNDDDTLTTGEAAAALGLRRGAISRRCKVGEIDAEKNDAGEWRIPTDEVERIKDERWAEYASTDRRPYPK